MYPMESHGVFQSLQEVGILTPELRVIRELSSKCRDLYDAYMVPKAPNHTLVGANLGYYTFLHLIGKKPPPEWPRQEVLYLICRRPWSRPPRENPHIREIVPLETIQEEISEGNIHIDTLVTLYGTGSITLDVLNASPQFGSPMRIPEYVPRVVQVGLGCPKLLRRVLAGMLVAYMEVSPPGQSYAKVIIDWISTTNESCSPSGNYLETLQEKIYWKAVLKRLRRSLNQYGEIANLERTDIVMLFGDLPPGWNLPVKLWESYGWFILTMNNECRGYLHSNLHHNRQYSKFTRVAQTVSLAKEVYKLVPHYGKCFFCCASRHYGGGDFDGDELNLLPLWH